MLDCYLRGGTINGRQVPGGFSYRNYLTKKPFGATDKTNINTAINLLQADPDLDLPLADFRTQAASDFVDALALREWHPKGWKKGKRLRRSAIKRIIVSIQPAWKMARHKWGFEDLLNPFEGTEIGGSYVPKKRRLRHGELENLVTASQKCENIHSYFIPLILYLAVETGMRIGELFDLTWQHVDFKRRRIFIRKAKRGPRMIVMPRFVFVALMRLAYRLNEELQLGDYVFTANDYVLYPTILGFNKDGERRAYEQFEDYMWDVRIEAGLYTEDSEDRWTVHIMRHEAEMSFRECLSSYVDTDYIRRRCSVSLSYMDAD